jgi:hypothetical protein
MVRKSLIVEALPIVVPFLLTILAQVPVVQAQAATPYVNC